mgnify:CR=1 FL=1
MNNELLDNMKNNILANKDILANEEESARLIEQYLEELEKTKRTLDNEKTHRIDKLVLNEID